MHHLVTLAATLAYTIDGPINAPVLVLSNSLGTDHTLWDKQLPAFAARFRVLRYDARGHGQSSVPAGPYRIADLGRDVLALLDALGLGRVHFCGLSMGGLGNGWPCTPRSACTGWCFATRPPKSVPSRPGTPALTRYSAMEWNPCTKP